MFGIRRQQTAAALLELRQHHRPGGDQRLLVGQGQILAGPNSSQGWQQTGATHDAGDHQIGTVPCSRHVQAIRTAHQLRRLAIGAGRAEGVETLLQLRKPLGIGQGHQLRLVALDLLNKKIEVAPGREGNHAELLGELLGDLKGLGADRARGAQHADGFHADPAVATSLPPGAANAGKLATA